MRMVGLESYVTKVESYCLLKLDMASSFGLTIARLIL